MTGPTAVTAQHRLDRVEARLAEVSTSLQAATGGAALCRIDGTGGSAKSFEGRTAALLEVRRLLRRDPEADLTPVLARWRADLASHTSRGSSAAWLEYVAGGVAELEHLLGTTPAEPREGDPT